MNPAEDAARIQAIAALNHHIDLMNMYIGVLRRNRRRRRRRQRRVEWVRPWIARRPDLGVYDRLMVELRAEDPTSFKNFLRMPPEMFDELLERLTPRLEKHHISRQTLSPGLKLALTLRHFASGHTYSAMKFAWRVPQNTISLVVREVCQAIQDEYLDEMLRCPTTPDEWRQVADLYYQRWNFPNTLGSVDGKHVRIICPNNSGSVYYNYKHFYSILLFVLVDADYKFLWADVSGNGAASDAQIYNDSELKRRVEDGTIGWPDPAPIPGDNQPMPYFIVGDDAFALRKTMMKPYSRRNLGHDERIFNYRLSRARRVVENAFGILAQRFNIFNTTMQQKPDTAREIIKTCLILHNMMRVRYPALQNQLLDRPEGRDRDFEPGAWRQDANMLDNNQVAAPNAATREGKAQRETLKGWCNSEVGCVAWQDAML